MKQYRPLIMRSNRFLGSALIERNLLSVEQLEAANERLLANIQAGDLRAANLLNILLFEMKALEEQALIEKVVEENAVGLIDLNNFNMLKISNEMTVDRDLCWATYSLPFDKVEDFTFVATAYYLSKPAIKAWEEKLGGQVVWYVSTITSIFNALGRLESGAEASVPQNERERTSGAGKEGAGSPVPPAADAAPGPPPAPAARAREPGMEPPPPPPAL